MKLNKKIVEGKKSIIEIKNLFYEAVMAKM